MWVNKMNLFGRKATKHSEAYTDFKAQLKAVGRQRMEGYDPNLFDKITEQERSEVEKDIWNHFMNKNDADLAVLMPALRTCLTRLRNRRETRLRRIYGIIS